MKMADYAQIEEHNIMDANAGVYDTPSSAAVRGEYDDAIGTFILRKNYFHAILCSICSGDMEGTNTMLGLYPITNDQRVLFDKVCLAIANENISDFTDAVYNYDRIKRLTPWETTLLLRIKEVLRV